MTLETLSKDELFNRSAEWINLNHHSPADSLIMKDGGAGKIAVKSTFNKSLQFGSIKRDIQIYYEVIIDVKPGKCRLQLTDINYKYFVNDLSEGTWVVNTFENQLRYVNNKMKHSESDNDTWVEFFKDCEKDFNAQLNSFAVFMQGASTH